MKNGELAEQLGVKQPQINDWKKGKREIPEHHLKKMQEIFEIPDENLDLISKKEFNEIILLQVLIISHEKDLRHADKMETKDVDEAVEIKNRISKMKNELHLMKGKLKVAVIVEDFKEIVSNGVLPDYLNKNATFDEKLTIVQEMVEELREKLK